MARKARNIFFSYGEGQVMAAGSNAGAALFSDAAFRLLGVMARLAGWVPDQFWAATPADVAGVLSGWVDDAPAASADRAALTALMEKFPDGG